MVSQLLSYRLAPRRWWAWLAAISVLGFGARILYIELVGSDLEIGADAQWYTLQAAIIRSGHGYLDPAAFFQEGREVATAPFPPLWPSLLAAVDFVGPSTQYTFQVVGAVIGTATVVLTGLLGRHVAGDLIALWAAGIVAASPALIAADGSLMSDTLNVALLTGATLLAARSADVPSTGRLVAFGFVSGAAGLTRSDSLVITVLLIATVVWCVRRADASVSWVRTALVPLAVVLVLVVPWSVRSSIRLEGPVLLSTNLGGLVEAANCDTTYRGSLIGAWDIDCLFETRRPGATEAERAEAAARRGFAFARSNVERVPLVAAVRVLRGFGLWNPFNQAPLEQDETRDEGWQIAAWAYALVMLLLAIPGFVILVRNDRWRTLPLLAVVAGVIVILLLSWGNPRFRLPAEPALAIAAATFGCVAHRHYRRSATHQPTGEAKSGEEITTFEADGVPGYELFGVVVDNGPLTTA